MNTSNQNIIRTSVIVCMMFLAALTRLIPHPGNLTAIMAVALFGGAKFKKTPLAVLIPLVVMLITDLFIGFYSLMPFVYSCIAITALIGHYVGQKRNPLFIIGGSVVASSLFFLITNASVWYHNPQYAQSITGLMLCYDAGIPFYRNQLFGDLFFNFILFGSYKLAKTKYPSLAY